MAPTQYTRSEIFTASKAVLVVLMVPNVPVDLP
jgi:hypothetical protein